MILLEVPILHNEHKYVNNTWAKTEPQEEEEVGVVERAAATSSTAIKYKQNDCKKRQVIIANPCKCMTGSY